jgi:hypothetical protein
MELLFSGKHEFQFEAAQSIREIAAKESDLKEK